MKEILIFAGTTEGRRLAEQLAASGIAVVVCVATEYGGFVLKEHPLIKVHSGRMEREEIKSFVESGQFLAVVDATHPYADVVTKNIQAALEGIQIPYFRLKREIGRKTAGEAGRVFFFDTAEACAKALRTTEGSILLTTGSKDLEIFCAWEEVRSRLYVRILPSPESFAICHRQGIKGKQILALQGPFTAQLNEAILRQYRIACLVTKNGGRNGGYEEKLKAAESVGIPVYVIGHPEEEGDSFLQVCTKLEELCGRTIMPSAKPEILLAGVGMGSRDGLTKEVSRAIETADILLGAERLLAPYQPKVEKRPYYKAEQILPYLQEVQKELLPEGGKVVILFSGDSGFYSGAGVLYRELMNAVRTGVLEGEVRILPGISSVSGLASRIKESWQDAAILSMHGKRLPGLAGRIKREEKTFLLMSGVKDVHSLGKLLLQAGMQDCEITAGYQLSYPEEKILYLTPEACGRVTEEGLYTCFIRNPHFERKRLTPGRADREFLRAEREKDRVPMTKEEVREVSICKLKLREGAVCYDIGSGTGSIAVELAELSDTLQVFAIERKRQAVSLLEQNKEKFRLTNLSIMEAEAPEGFERLPTPTHAFIGGSGGRLKEILSALYRKNSGMRIVINAVSVETICEIKEILTEYPVEEEELVQIQVNRTRKAGTYHLMQAENPVWICAFQFGKER